LVCLSRELGIELWDVVVELRLEEVGGDGVTQVVFLRELLDGELATVGTAVAWELLLVGVDASLLLVDYVDVAVESYFVVRIGRRL